MKRKKMWETSLPHFSAVIVLRLAWTSTLPRAIWLLRRRELFARVDGHFSRIAHLAAARPTFNVLAWLVRDLARSFSLSHNWPPFNCDCGFTNDLWPWRPRRPWQSWRTRRPRWFRQLRRFRRFRQPDSIRNPITSAVSCYRDSRRD